MLRQALPLLLLQLLLFAAVTLGQDVKLDSELARDRRGTVTIDFGLLLRNLLLKSAQFSNAKANLTRTLANAKTTKRPWTTTTTTPAPPPPPPKSKPRRPFYGTAWRPYDLQATGYIPYDYDAADYEEPPSKRRPVRPPPRPLSAYYAQKAAPPPPRYDYDYDYDTAVPAPAPPPAPAPAPAPAPKRARPPPSQPPRRPPPPPSQLRDKLVYQYAQPADTYSRPIAYEGGEAEAEAAEAEARSDKDEDGDGDGAVYDNSSPNNNADGAYDGNSAVAVQDSDDGVAEKPPTPPRFYINYAKEENAIAEYDKAPPTSSTFNVDNFGAAYLGFGASANGNAFGSYSEATAAPPSAQQQQQYYLQ